MNQDADDAGDKTAPFGNCQTATRSRPIGIHWHPTDEQLAVLDGTFMVGMGDQFSESALKPLSAGSYGKMPQHMNHFAAAKGATTIQSSR